MQLSILFAILIIIGKFSVINAKIDVGLNVNCVKNNLFAFRLLDNKFNIEKSTTRSGKEFLLVNLPYYCIGKIFYWIDYVIDRGNEDTAALIN